MFDILKRRPVPLSEVRPDLPKELSALVDRMLSCDPEARPTSAIEVLQALERCALAFGVNRSRAGTLRDDSELSRDITRARLPRVGTGMVWSRALVAMAFSAVLAIGFWRRAQPARGAQPVAQRGAAPLCAPIDTSAASAAPALPMLPVSAEQVVHGLARRVAAKRLASTSGSAALGTGSLHLSASPKWVRVRLDGIDVGSTPLALSDVKAGIHWLEAVPQDGGPPQRRTVDVLERQTEHVNFRFDDAAAFDAH